MAYPLTGRPKVLNRKVLFGFQVYLEEAGGRGFPRFLRKFEFCGSTFFSLEFSNLRSRDSISIASKKFTDWIMIVPMAQW